jgi:hypothetical protein
VGLSYVQTGKLRGHSTAEAVLPQPPTPCVPRAHAGCALFPSDLRRAAGACRWRGVRAYFVVGSEGQPQHYVHVGNHTKYFWLYCLYGFINRNVSTELHLSYFVKNIRNITK